MPKIKHKELLRQVHYNPLTGLFIRRISNANNVKVGDIAGSLNKINGYIEITINKKSYYGHVLAWFYYYEYWPENNLDHRNRKRHCNWILNLREVTQVCNLRNTGNPKDNTSGVKGVSWNKNDGIWEVRIKAQNKGIYLGRYKNFDEAVCHRLACEQANNWAGCDSESPAFLYIKNNIQNL